MNRTPLKRSLITIGLLALVCTVDAETYYTHKVAERIEANDNSAQTQQAPGPIAGTDTWPGYGTWDPWLEMHRIQQRIDSPFEDSWHRMQADFGAMEPASRLFLPSLR